MSADGLAKLGFVEMSVDQRAPLSTEGQLKDEPQIIMLSFPVASSVPLKFDVN